MKHMTPVDLSQVETFNGSFWDILGINLGYITNGKDRSLILVSLKDFNVGIIPDLFDQFQSRHAEAKCLYPTLIKD